MKKLAVTLVGLAAIFVAVASGFTADKSQTPSAKDGDQKAKARRDAEPQYRDEDILGTRTGPDGKIEKVIRPGAKPIQAGSAAKQPDAAKKADGAPSTAGNGKQKDTTKKTDTGTPAAATAGTQNKADGAKQPDASMKVGEPAKPSAPVKAGTIGQDKPVAATDAKKDAAGKKPEDKSLAKKGEAAGAVIGTKPAPSKSSLADKKRSKKAAHGKRHRKRYATRHRRRHHARRHARYRYAHKRGVTRQYMAKHKHKRVKAHKNAAATPAAPSQDATKLKKNDKPAGTKQDNKAAATPQSTK